MLLKERPTDIAVEAEGEVVIDVENTLLKVICMIHRKYKIIDESDLERIKDKKERREYYRGWGRARN